MLFLGVSVLAFETGARPSTEVSVLSEVARAVFRRACRRRSGSSPCRAYLRDSGAGRERRLPGVPLVERDPRARSLPPRCLREPGGPALYSNGIALLALVAAFLLVAFNANPNALLHLYLLGVFTAFTLSQVGMLRHWHRSREPGRRRRMAVNGLGAAGTALVDLLILGTKFGQGAWMVLIAIPALMACLYAHERHHRRIRTRLRTGTPDPSTAPRVTTVLALNRLDGPGARALAVARGLRATGIHSMRPLSVDVLASYVAKTRSGRKPRRQRGDPQALRASLGRRWGAHPPTR
jgi:hypothetical protein